MDIFRQHEEFEIEVLDKMNSARLLEPLVFGGGSMLRLCHELNRYSVDIEFLLRRGVELPVLGDRQSIEFRDKLAGFKDRDFKVK